ncbi:DUF2442 domain-containing protein [Spirosoma montaniterrae]|uniref:DUF2442 domain-containing protein n=1 Tax=Spirosoma montaniterrae TaxID=1178516 RepID=A0A1P9WVC3_9BACT|nr:DUF2442 domain-containing protein [Spirosoma montaniterrae]AQG79342.1 hypothetical protein AWR27_08430 [Spirosoma montaniterrae]
MTSLENNIVDKPATDPVDQLILERGLRIKQLFFSVEMDRMLILLTNGNVLNLRLSQYERLKNATSVQLLQYSLIGNGIAVSWDELDEDLSLKGFIKQAALTNAVRQLEVAV